MLRYHMCVVTRDQALKRSIKRLTTATGATADFAVDTAINPTRPINLAIFDARSEMPDRRFLGQVPKSAHVIYIVPGEDLAMRVQLFEDMRVTSLFCYDERFDDDEFISSATKALHGEIFGLQKYFPWGVTTFSMVVKSYEEKGRAIEIMMRYAQMAGVRGPVRDRIQLVADELMMNALYHAPVDSRGQEKYRGMTQKQLAQLPEVNPIQVQYGCSGRYFGVAVRDGGGSLHRDRALEYLVRARSGAQMEKKASGAGLGLISVLHSVSKLVFNLAPGYSTEVIALFDMELFARGKVGARSLHLFTTSASAAAGVDDDDEETRVSTPRAPAPRRAGAPPGSWPPCWGRPLPPCRLPIISSGSGTPAPASRARTPPSGCARSRSAPSRKTPRSASTVTRWMQMSRSPYLPRPTHSISQSLGTATGPGVAPCRPRRSSVPNGSSSHSSGPDKPLVVAWSSPCSASMWGASCDHAPCSIGD